MDYFTDITKEPNIIYDRKNMIGISHIKINIYNKDLPIPMHPFWFLIKKTKICDYDNKVISIIINEPKIIDYIQKLELCIKRIK
jgi:hypothetical protein